MKLFPSKEIWRYMQGNITPLSVASAAADVLGGYHIAYSANEVLKDLQLITSAGRITKRGRRVISHYLHAEYHKTIERVVIVNPMEVGGEV